MVFLILQTKTTNYIEGGVMRKVLIVLVAMFLVMSSNLFAQKKTVKGQIELGGNFGFSSSSFSYKGESEGTITAFSFSPRIGFFVINKFEIEPQIQFVSVSMKPEAGETETETDFGGILSLSYNFESGSNLVPFVFAGIGMQTHSITDVEDLKTTMIAPELGAGLKAFFSEKGALRAEVYYNHMTNAGGYEDESANTFGLRVGLSVFLK